MNLVARLVFKF